MTLLDPTRARALCWVVVATAVGLSLGAPLYRLERAAMQPGASWISVAVVVAADCLVPALTGVYGVVLLRRAEPRNLFAAASALVPPLILAQRVHTASGPLFVLAVAGWGVATVACSREKRTLGMCGVLVCSVCTTLIQLDSALAKCTGGASPSSGQEPDWRSRT